MIGGYDSDIFLQARSFGVPICFGMATSFWRVGVFESFMTCHNIVSCFVTTVVTPYLHGEKGTGLRYSEPDRALFYFATAFTRHFLLVTSSSHTINYAACPDNLPKLLQR